MTSSDPADLTEALRGLIRDYTRRLRAESEGTSELTITEETALARVHQHPRSTSADLARLEGVRPQSMNTTVSRLITAGHIAADRDPDDGRRRVLHLTDSGRTLIETVRDRRSDWLRRQVTTQLTDAQRRDVAAAVDHLRALLEN